MYQRQRASGELGVVIHRSREVAVGIARHLDRAMPHECPKALPRAPHSAPQARAEPRTGRDRLERPINLLRHRARQTEWQIAPEPFERWHGLRPKGAPLLAGFLRPLHAANLRLNRTACCADVKGRHGNVRSGTWDRRVIRNLFDRVYRNITPASYRGTAFGANACRQHGGRARSRKARRVQP
jgi:hypothetical protein